MVVAQVIRVRSVTFCRMSWRTAAFGWRLQQRAAERDGAAGGDRRKRRLQGRELAFHVGRSSIPRVDGLFCRQAATAALRGWARGELLLASFAETFLCSPWSERNHERDGSAVLPREETACSQQAPLLEIIGVSKRFPGVVALDDVSFDIRPGEVHALIGENGAGKSTLMKIIGGIYQPSDGEIRVDGKARSFPTPHASRDAGIAMVHQEPKLCGALSVAENVLMGALPRRGLVVSWKEANRRTTELMARVGLSIAPTTDCGRTVDRRAPAAADRPGALADLAPHHPRRADGEPDAL